MAKFWLTLILVLGLLIRMYQINPALLELIPNRQLIDAQIVRGLYLRGLTNLDLHVFGMPLYHWLVAGIYKVGGGVWETWGRLVSVGFSVLTGWMFYKLLSLLGSERRALIGLALFYLFSPVHIIMSRSFLIDEMTLFFAIAAVYFAALYSKSPKARWYWLSLGLMILTWLSKYTFGYVILPALWWLKGKSSRLIGYVGLTLLPSIWWYLYAKRFNELLAGGPTGEWQLSFIFDPKIFLQSEYYLNFFSHLSKYALTPAWLPLLVLGMLLRIKNRSAIPWYLWLIGAGMFLGTFNIASRTHSYYFLAMVAPMVWFAASAGEWVYLKSKKWLAISGNVLAFLLIGVGLLTVMSDEFFKAYRTYVPYENVPMVGRITAGMTSTDTPIIVSTNRMDGVLYFSDRAGWELRLGPLNDIEAIEKLEQMRGWGGRSYVIYDAQELITKPGFKKYLENNYLKVFSAPDLSTEIFSLCEKRLKSC